MPAPKGNQHAKGNRGGGRPTSYSPRYPKIVQELCELGATDSEIADKLGISHPTLILWRSTHVEFAEALKVGKELSDERVARSLYHCAVGFSVEAQKPITVRAIDGSTSVKIVSYRNSVPPDPKAAMDWLKNRRKGEWSDKTDATIAINANFTTTRKIDISGLSDDQLDALEAALSQTLLTIEHEPTPVSGDDAEKR